MDSLSSPNTSVEESSTRYTLSRYTEDFVKKFIYLLVIRTDFVKKLIYLLVIRTDFVKKFCNE